jgi:hypothetical protein
MDITDAERVVMVIGKMEKTLTKVRTEIAVYKTEASTFCGTDDQMEKLKAWVPRAEAAIAAFHNKSEDLKSLLHAALLEM